MRLGGVRKVQNDLFKATAPAKRGLWPSEQLTAYLSGESVGTDAIRSWAAFEIWQAAQQICAMPTLEKRRTALEKIPVTIRPLVKDDMRRIWKTR